MNIRENVQEYYGKRLKTSADLKTNACKTRFNMTPKLKEAIVKVPEEIKVKYYGCGLVFPEFLEGCSILDLGCGTGRDCYVLSQLVGKNGRIVGVDMTDESLEVAISNVSKFQQTVEDAGAMEFLKGYLENIPCENNSFDIAVSNCVINLCSNKEVVLKECFRILKEGGELYFSDVYCDSKVPQEAKENEILWGDCISGALVWTELFDIAEKIGFTTPRIVEMDTIEIQPEIAKLVENINFASVTYRLFKKTKSFTDVEVTCPKLIKYVPVEGTDAPEVLKLDYFLQFKTNEEKVVDGEWAKILEVSRFKSWFLQQAAPPTSLPENKEVKVNPFTLLQKCSTTKSCCGTKKCG